MLYFRFSVHECALYFFTFNTLLGRSSKNKQMDVSASVRVDSQLPFMEIPRATRNIYFRPFHVFPFRFVST